MSTEKIQLALQAISVIGVPILTAFIAWIVGSLKKTNNRIDDLKDEYHKNRLEDRDKFNELNANIREVAAAQKHTFDVAKGTQDSVRRIESFLLKNK